MHVGLFENESLRPEFRRLVGISIITMGREDENPGVRLHEQDLTGGFQTIEQRHGNVHDNHSRAKFFDFGDRLAAILRFPDHLEVAFHFQHKANPLAHHRMVFNQQDGNTFYRFSFLLYWQHCYIRTEKRAGCHQVFTPEPHASSCARRCAVDWFGRVIHICLTMKTATVRDLRNHFPRVAAWIAEGESVEITKSGKLFARLMPPEPVKSTKLVKPDIMARLKETWGDRIFSAKEVAEMRAAELEGEEG